MIYYHGYAGERDFQKAFYWYRRAADKNIGEAQFALAVMLHAGEGTPKDKKMALDWMRKAAKSGYHPAVAAAKALEDELKNSKGAR